MSKVPEGLPRETIKKDIASLLIKFSEEQIFFSINYLAKYYPEDLQLMLKHTILFHSKEWLRFYNLAKLKREVRESKERDKEYDSRNTNKGTDTPQWFRAGIDFDLFK